MRSSGIAILTAFALVGLDMTGQARDFELPEVVPSDMAFSTGISTGTISRKKKTSDKVETYQLGGVPFNLGFYTDRSQNWTTMWQMQMVFDFNNDQILRKGVDTGFEYYLFGGGHNIKKQYPGGTGSGSFKKGFSLSGRIGWHSYTAIAKQETTIELTGSAVETKLGFMYRSSIDEGNDISFQVLQTVMSLPWDKEQITATMTEALIGWRLII